MIHISVEESPLSPEKLGGREYCSLWNPTPVECTLEVEVTANHFQNLCSLQCSPGSISRPPCPTVGGEDELQEAWDIGFWQYSLGDTKLIGHVCLALTRFPPCYRQVGLIRFLPTVLKCMLARFLHIVPGYLL